MRIKSYPDHNHNRVFKLNWEKTDIWKNRYIIWYIFWKKKKKNNGGPTEWMRKQFTN